VGWDRPRCLIYGLKCWLSSALRREKFGPVYCVATGGRARARSRKGRIRIERRENSRRNWSALLPGAAELCSLRQKRWGAIDTHPSTSDEIRAARLRKIDQHRFLRSQRIFKQARWIDLIFLLHVFDHPVMNTAESRPSKMYSPVNVRPSPSIVNPTVGHLKPRSARPDPRRGHLHYRFFRG